MLTVIHSLEEVIKPISFIIALTNAALWAVAAQQINPYLFIGVSLVAILLSFTLFGIIVYLYAQNQRLNRLTGYMSDEIHRSRGISYKPVTITGLKPPMKLMKALEERFSEEELKDLIFEFGLEGKFNDDTKGRMAREFLVYAVQHHLVGELETWIKKNRVDIDI